VEEREGSTNGHTPGPWVVTAAGPPRVISPRGRIVADCGKLIAEDPRQAEANARLCAAAPELLAAAELALAHLRCEYADPVQVAARDALVKAVARAGGRP
jgi:hypothetical protein